MEIVIVAAVAIAVLAYVVYKNLDLNRDGKVTKEEAKAVLDTNKDGKINKDDAKAAVKKATTKAKTTAKKTVAKAKKAVTKKK